MNKFVTKTGWLTRYALACGYAEVNQDWKNKRVATLWKDSACYQVQGYDDDKRNMWESFNLDAEGYKEAKTLYLQILKQAKVKRTINKPSKE